MPDQENRKDDELESLKLKLTEALKERDEYLAGWQRSKADFINHKKDELERLQKLAKYGTEDLILELIGVLDNFDLGLAALEKAGPVEKGIYMIRTQISDILRKRGLQPLGVKEGDQFDPGLSEAVSEQESNKPPGTILEVIETGYELHDKIIRPTRVKISKGQT